MPSKAPLAILGAGSWGTALALVVARNNHKVRIWGNDIDDMAKLDQHRVNDRYLPGHSFPDTLLAYHDLSETLQDVKDVLIVVPSHAFAEVIAKVKHIVSKPIRLAWASKGLDPENCQLLHYIVQHHFGQDQLMAVLSGPSFAKEVANQKPTVINCASNSDTFYQDLMEYFSCESFQLSKCNDIIGVELGGVVKNVMAIAVGMCDGLDFGANTRSALITQGLKEMALLNKAMGGEFSTMLDLACLGDLILTCTDNLSRNRRFGLAIGNGKTPKQALEEIAQVVEGYDNVKQLKYLSIKYNVCLPMVNIMYQVLESGFSAEKAILNMISSKI